MSKNWQERAGEFALERNLDHSPGVYALDAMSEMGEVAKEILLASDYGSRAPQFGPDIAAELGDLLYSICMLATSSGVDLESTFNQTLEKYNKRWETAGDLGSHESEVSTGEIETT